MPVAKKKVSALAIKDKPQIIRARRPEAPVLSSPVEQALIQGNLLGLTPQQRVELYMATCKSLGLNPLTRPFDYILFSEWNGTNERLELYAKASASDQLGKIHGVSDVPSTLKRWTEDGMLMAEICVKDREGRTRTEVGAVPTSSWSKKDNKWYEISGAQLANAKMKVVTKARRRGILRLCGLGLLDESELDTLRVLGGVTREGRIYRLPDDSAPPSQVVPLIEETYEQELAHNPHLAKYEEREKAQKAETHQEAPQAPLQPPKAVIPESIPTSSPAPPERQEQPNKAPIAEVGDIVAGLIAAKGIQSIKNGKCRKLTVLLPSNETVTIYCWNDHKRNDGTTLFGVLDMLNSLSRPTPFRGKVRKKDQYLNLIGLELLGETEYDESGEPIIKREPATKGGLFEGHS